jgi:hypothetical protein
MILLLDGKLCSISNDGSVKIWSIETGVCDLTVQVSIQNNTVARWPTSSI